ncbi:MAG: DUF4230 domain-containing protein [Bacteroidaceae bacterium]|nr:DUF4230 domain-containing protein [Bacteroidaceae bacterium]
MVVAAILLTSACTSVSEQPADTHPDASVADSVDLVLAVARTSRLHTAEYRVHKIVTHSDVKFLRTTLLGHTLDTRLSLGDRKIAIPIDVTLKAYIDFSGFNESQIERSPDGQKIHITLPDPKVVVTSSKIDHQSTRQYTDLLRSDFTDEEMTDFTAQGVRAILKTVPQMGILTTARQSAARTLMPLIASMGYAESDIVITFRKEFTESDLPQLIDNERSVVKL